jgi:hypothetical protein
VTRETEDTTERDRRRYRRERITAELGQLLSGQAEVGLTLEAEVTMARVRGSASRG